MEKKISLIIPAYNEAKQIGRVLKTVKNHPLIGEVIVVNDGSTDETSKEVKKYRFVKLIDLEKNSGKAYAVKKGVSKAKNDIIMLLDADLINLKKENITQLGLPVIEGIADITLSLRNYTSIVGAILNLSKVDWLTGDRCLKKSFFNSLKITKSTKYGLEVVMNEQIILENLKITVVDFRNVSCVYKIGKLGLYQGILGEVKATKQIFKSMPPLKIAVQMIKLAKLKKTNF